MTWKCPCNGCAKAVKQERERISQAIDEIDLNTTSQLNALGMKLLIMNIINPPKSEAKSRKA